MPRSGSRLVSNAHSLLYSRRGVGGISLASRKMEKGGTNEEQVTELMLVSKKQFNLFV